ncbi:MAG: DUF4388 domain-containing protein [Candidatus Aminicenantes bacterium]|nr:MAG: DUF4388 domain-containing protein [Candidatus Aminicenantes bacterium]
MEEKSLQGNLTELPFAHLLFRCWQREKSGCLKLKKDKIEKKLYLEKGEIAVKQGSFPEKDFLQNLAEKSILDPSSFQKHESFASQDESSLIMALVELGTFSPSKLWELMEVFFKEDLFPVFDWSQGEYLFASADLPKEPAVLFSIQILNFTLEGVRKMKNFDLMKAHIPPEDSAIQILQPDYLNQIKLEPHEKYLLNVIDEKNELKTILESSKLGEKETQKTLFALSSLGIIGTPHESGKDSLPQGTAPVGFNNTLDAFNEKCIYIYKYISKEIGPVALNVLGKCLEEIKAHLSPHSQKIELGTDGKIKMSSLLKAKTSFFSEEDRKLLLRDMNEILAAEVLAVKKTLGNEHERALVENLKRLGN